MRGFHKALIGVACLMASASVGCKKRDSAVDDDVKDVARATEKAAKDIGHATVDLADKAGQDLHDATKNAGVTGQDAWITTKVKSVLTTDGFDPLHVHVDTDGKVVTLTGSVESSAKAGKAVSLAKSVEGVAGVRDHLFVKPAER